MIDDPTGPDPVGLDPIGLALVQKQLDHIARQMGWVMMRTARSPTAGSRLVAASAVSTVSLMTVNVG